MAIVESKTIYVNSAPKQVRAILEQGENYVHLRELVAALGGEVRYDAVLKRVDIECGR